MTPRLADLDYRYERKYHAWDNSPQELERALKQHEAHFVDAFPPRWVNNIYFDSPSLRNFTTHVNGASRRAKLRIRWYGDRFGEIAKPILEVKIKRAEVGTKLHYPIEPFEFDGTFDLERMRRSLRSHGGESAELIGNSAPVLFNRYHRRYYRTTDHRFRMTIDTEMSFHVVNRRVLGPLSEYRERHLTVLELKYDVNQDERAARIGAGMPFLLGKNSKYVHGIQYLSGNRE